MKCSSCKYEDDFSPGELTAAGQYKRICNQCGMQTGLYPKENTANRPAAHRRLVSAIGIEYCEDCLRHKTELPPPQVLEAHHIIEYKDGGTDDRSNIKILCTPCHREIHHKRTYYSHYKNILK